MKQKRVYQKIMYSVTVWTVELKKQNIGEHADSQQGLKVYIYTYTYETEMGLYQKIMYSVTVLDSGINIHKNKTLGNMQLFSP